MSVVDFNEVRAGSDFAAGAGGGFNFDESSPRQASPSNPANIPDSTAQAPSQAGAGLENAGIANTAANNTRDRLEKSEQEELEKARKREAALLKAQKTAEQRAAEAKERLKKALAQKDLAAKENAEKRLRDLELTQEQLRKEKDKKRLIAEDAEKAFDSQVRKELLKAVNEDEEVVRLQKEQIDLTKSLAQLLQIAATSVQRSKGMNSLPLSGGIVAANSGNAGGGLKGSAISKREETDTDVSSKSLDQELLTRLEAALAKAESEEKTAGRPPLTPEQKALLRERLRTSLRAKLAAQYQTQLASASPTTSSGADPFTGQLKREVASAPAEAPVEETHGMGDVIGSTFSAFQDQQTGFAMGTAETEAAVNGILEESGRDLASDSAAGVLAEDSPALFIRVNEAYRRCAKRLLAKSE